MRVAVIGCGSIGRRHIGNLLALGCHVNAHDVNSTALARVRAEYPAAHIGSDGIECDACVIATPAANHLQWVESTVRLGVPFFVEKPLGTLEQLPRWRELAAAALPVNQVGYMLRFHPKAQEMKALIPAPLCGSFYVAADMRTWPGTLYGPMLLEFSHEIDLALWFGATPFVTYASISELKAAIAMGPWWVTMQDGAPYTRQWSITEEIRGYQWAFNSPEELGVEMYRTELEHFLACIQQGKPTACTLADGLAVLEVCAQVETSARSAPPARPVFPPNRVIREGDLA